MKPWTRQAWKRLDQYLELRAAKQRLALDLVADFRRNLRKQIEAEAERDPAPTIDLPQLEAIFERIEPGYERVTGYSRLLGVPRRPSRLWTWIAGVWLPLAVLILEAVSSMCSGVFFNPIPTWMHFLLVALVPGLNAWLLNDAPGAGVKWHGAAAGVTLIISAFYGLLFVPLIPLSVVALLLFGFGMVSLSPVLAWISSWRIGGKVRAAAEDAASFKKGWRMGVTGAVAALLMLEGPALWTRVNVSQAVSQGPNSAAAISRLRFFHSEGALLKPCYETRVGWESGTDVAGWIMDSWSVPALMFGFREVRTANPDKAQNVFFRVTGKAFNSVEPPASSMRSLMAGNRNRGDFEFDENQGGDVVAGRLRNLDLKESRFDGHIDSVSRIGYGEWTMIFHNASRAALEARCQVKLPAGGRISRLTLWVNGEPREAAFSTVSKVKAAYKDVAIEQRRDPVLVTMVGPDTVLVQCFPVPANGEMKIRFGVTAPLDNGHWDLPQILERNFGTEDGLRHAVWLQADKDFKISGAKKAVAANADGPGKSLSISLPVADMLGSEAAVVMDSLPADPATVWCEDQFAAANEKFLIRQPKKRSVEGSGKVVLVIDGSAAVADFKNQLVDAMGAGVIGILADDTVRSISRKTLGGYRFSGGRDNEPALRQGIRISKEQGGLPIVWIHGAQAVDLSQAEALLQLLERGSVMPVIYEVQAGGGPNRLAEAIYRSGALKRGPKLGKSTAPISTFVNGLRNGHEEAGWSWQRLPASEIPPGAKVWNHLARLWAIGVVEDPRQAVAGANVSEIAARYQLVTPVSGAVVLETQGQYAQHGLTPGDPAASPKIPGVPEPSTGILVVISAAALILRRKRPAESDVTNHR